MVVTHTLASINGGHWMTGREEAMSSMAKRGDRGWLAALTQASTGINKDGHRTWATTVPTLLIAA